MPDWSKVRHSNSQRECPDAPIEWADWVHRLIEHFSIFDAAGTLTLTRAPTETVTANCCASPATVVSDSIASPLPPVIRPGSPQRRRSWHRKSLHFRGFYSLVHRSYSS